MIRKCYTKQKCMDEDWKTQLAKGYPIIPANTEVDYEGEFFNFYGKYVKVRYKGILYYVKPRDIYFADIEVSENEAR